MSLELLAEVAAATASPLEASRLAGAAARLRTERAIEIGHVHDAQRLEAALAACRQVLGDEIYAAAWSEG